MLKRALVVGLGLVLLSSQAAVGAPRTSSDRHAQRQHHTARRQPVRSGDRDRSDRSDQRRRVLEPRARRGHGPGPQHRRGSDLERVAVRARRPVRQGVLRSHVVVGRLRQPLHGVDQPRGLGRHPGRDQHRRRSDVPHAEGAASEPAGSCEPRTVTAGRGRGRRRGRGGEAGRRREGAGAEPERLDRRPADDRVGRGIRLAHVEQQRHHAGVGGACVRAGPGGEVLQTAGHPEEQELQLR